MGEGTAVSNSGQAALDWLSAGGSGNTSAAEKYAHGLLKRAGITAAQEPAQDVVQEVAIKLWMYLTKPPPKELDTPVAYARTVLHNHISKIKQGQTTELPEDLEQVATSRDRGKNFELLVRSELESLGREDPWLTSAALSYYTLLMHPECAENLSELPSPAAGSTEAQARCWTALWISGQRDLFPPHGTSSDPALRKKRSNYINKVIQRVEAARVAVARSQQAGTPPTQKGAAHA